MLVVQGYCPKDAAQAERLARWTLELGGCRGHSLLLIHDTRIADPERIAGIYRQSFDSVELMPFVDHYDKWPQAPNAIFGMVARHIAANYPQPWLFWEPDCIPLSAGWLDAIAAEYQAAVAAGKLFLGDFVSVHTPELDVPDHMSGNAVYPGNMIEHAGTALIAGDLAWDVVAAQQILPLMKTSELLLHAWKHPRFESMEQVQREIFAIKPKCVLFHASKDGSLIELLQQNLREKSGPVDTPNASLARAGGAGDFPEKMMDSLGIPKAPTCDILIKSYPQDYELLSYCLRSIEKFANGFRRVIVVYPKGASPDLENIPPRTYLIPVEEHGDGYLFQQAVKSNAHEYTDADYILHQDSDTVLTKPVTPQTFFRDGKPLWIITPYEVLRRGIEEQKKADSNFFDGVMAWKPITEKFLGEPVEFEYMRRFPLLVPRSLHVSADVFCRVRHRMSLTQYILSQTNREFSEFNALGALAYSRARNDFSWLNTTKEQLPEQVAWQTWSHEPLMDARRAEFEEILGGRVAELADASDLKSDGETRAGSNPVSPIRQTAAGIWIIDGDKWISAWVEEKGQLQHDYFTLPLVLEQIKAGDTVVDVGANIGDTTWPFLERVGTLGRVVAFEPNSDAFECLKLNMAAFRNVTLENVGLGDVPAGVYLEVGTNAGAASIAEHGKGIVIVPLDSRDLDRCDLIKIDVEGYELKVLRGAEQTVAKFHPKLVIEINEGALRRQGTTQGEIFEWLREHGYQWWTLNQANLEQDLPQYDILCRWDSHAPPQAIKKLVEEVDPIKPFDEPRARSENFGEQAPWANVAESMEEVRLLCARLREFCTAPLRVCTVRAELERAKVIPHQVRRRKRGR